MFAKTIAAAIGGILMAVSLSACSGNNDTQHSAPAKPTAAMCSKLSVQVIGKREVQLTAEAKWAKGKKSPITGYTFQLVDLEREREPYHSTDTASKSTARFAFDVVKPSKYSARVVLQTRAGAVLATEHCMVTIHVY